MKIVEGSEHEQEEKPEIITSGKIPAGELAHVDDYFSQEEEGHGQEMFQHEFSVRFFVNSFEEDGSDITSLDLFKSALSQLAVMVPEEDEDEEDEFLQSIDYVSWEEE